MRLLFFLALIFVVYYILTSLHKIFKTKINGHSQKVRSENTNDQIVDELVKDPICGVYVAKKQALRVKDGGRTIYFCSETCKQKYIEDKKC